MSFKGKVAIVTGSSSGIGAATAIEFAKEGADVVLVGRNQEKLDNVAAICEKSGNKPLVVNADVSKENQAERMIKETVDKFGRIDILVNNAGLWRAASIESDNIMEVYDTTMGVNLRAIFHITHLAVPYLIKTKGNIINISSIGSVQTSLIPSSLSYNVSKAAVDHFTRCVALDLASKGVRVNVINPGPVKTDVAENAGMNAEHAAAFWERMRDATALKRISEPKEIADLVLFLASDKAAAITGSSIISDNGMIVKT